MSIESLKKQARKHEQNEEWQKALDQYKKALAELDREEQVDIGLYNRVGDLYVRVGGLDPAVEHYEKAVDLYREAYLPNNAIAVCKKIIRNVPARHRAYLVIGQIRAEQGFLPDARTNFLTYAERMAGDGDLDESFRALIEFCDLAPDDIGVRITVADQMIAQHREEEAVEQLAIAHRHYTQLGDTQKAEDLKTRIFTIDPEADVDAMAAGLPASSVGSDGEIMADFGDISLGGGAFDSGPEAEVEISMEEAVEEASGDDEAESESGLEDFAIAGAEDEDDGEAVELPMMGFESSEEDEGEAVELPMMGLESSDEDVGEAVELPMMGLESSDEDEGEAVELPMMDFESSGDDEGEAVELPTMDFESSDEGGAVELPTMEFESSDEDEGEAIELPMMDSEPFDIEAPVLDAAEDVIGEIEIATGDGTPIVDAVADVASMPRSQQHRPRRWRRRSRRLRRMSSNPSRNRSPRSPRRRSRCRKSRRQRPMVAMRGSSTSER